MGILFSVCVAAMSKLNRQKKLEVVKKAGYHIIDFDGVNVLKDGKLLKSDCASIEEAIDWAFKHLMS